MSKKYWTILASSLVVVFLVSFYSCRTSDQRELIRDYDVVIIGSGPGGLTAGIYTSRAKRSTLILEGDEPGGLLTKNPEVENWPGEKSISGYDLMEKIREHAMHTGCKLVDELMVDIDLSENPYRIRTYSGKEYKAKSVIIAMGVERRKLGCPGEEKYLGRGVSYCATCDASFFKGEKVVVVGGGATALTEAHHLSHHASDVIIVYRGPKFKTIDPIKYVVEEDENVSVRYNSIVKEIRGDENKVTSVVIVENSGTSEEKEYEMPVGGAFISIGFDPNTQILKSKIDLDDRGYIKVDNSCQTSKPGVFAIGDIISQDFQQAAKAAGDGCKGGMSVVRFLDVGA